MRARDVRRHRVLCAAVAVVTAGTAAVVLAAVAAEAAGGVNLLPNPGFEGVGAGSVTGWVASTKARLTPAAGGAGGAWSGHVAFTGASTGAFSVETATKPVKNVPKGEVFTADAQLRVSKVVKKPICLQLVEQGSAGTVQTVSRCVTPSDTDWHQVGATSLTTKGAGTSVRLVVRQASGASGYSFDVDDVSFVDPDTAPPSTPTGVTALVVAGASPAVTVSWTPSTDSFGGVAGYRIYRNNRSSVLANVTAGTSYTDRTVVEGNTYSYTVVGYDVAGNVSPVSGFGSVVVPWTSAPVAGSVWHLDDAAGSTVMADSTGSNPGNLIGTVIPGGGTFRFVAASSTSGGYVQVPAAASLNPGPNRVQFSIKVRMTTLPAVPDYDLFRKGVAPGQEYKLEIQPNGQPTCSFTGDVGHATVQNGASLKDGRWHTITCSKDDTTVTLTIDGQSWTKTVTIGSIVTAKDLVIGAYPGYDFYNGEADEATLRIG